MKFFNSFFAGILAAPVLARTNFTSDTWMGKPVITSLDITDTPPNRISQYYFVAGTQFGGIPLLLPVFVARGTNSSLRTGRKLSVSASIHGEELNGVPVVQRLFNNQTFRDQVYGGRFNGTIIGIPTMNPNGNQHNQRLFYSGDENGRWSDLNRLFPGTDPAEVPVLAEAYVYNIWNGIWGNTSNVDIAVDLHTVSSGASSPLWAYADYRFPYVQRMAELVEADIIKIDPGDPGTVETTFIENNVPAITLEIGTPKLWQNSLITRSEAYLWRLMEDLRMMSSNATRPFPNLENTSRWTNFSNVATTTTGWVEPLVELLDMVEDGQTVARVYDSWGETVEVLNSTVVGQVQQVRTDPIVEQGTGVIRIAYNATSEDE